MTTYKAVPGSRMTNEQAQRYGDYIATLVEDTNNHVDPKVIVAHCQDKELADWFEQDTNKAVYNYHVVQAYELLRFINVDFNGTITRAFQPVTIRVSEVDEQNIYATIEYITQDVDLMDQIVKRAKLALRAWTNKYRQYKELQELVGKVDELLK